jgi:hypothetical protein
VKEKPEIQSALDELEQAHAETDADAPKQLTD